MPCFYFSTSIVFVLIPVINIYGIWIHMVKLMVSGGFWPLAIRTEMDFHLSNEGSAIAVFFT